MQALHKVWIWMNDALWQGSEYAWSMFHKVLNEPPLLNMSGLRIWQSCEYVNVTQIMGYTDYAWINLNNALIMSQYDWICLSNTEYD